MRVALRAGAMGLALLLGWPGAATAAEVGSAGSADTIEAASGARATTLSVPGAQVRPAQRRALARLVDVPNGPVAVTVTAAVSRKPSRGELRRARARAAAVARTVRALPTLEAGATVRIGAPARVRRPVGHRVRVVVRWGETAPVPPPREVAGTAAESSIVVRWREPGTASPNAYRAYAFDGTIHVPGTEPVASTPACDSAKATTCTITGLRPGRAYLIAVAAFYDAGRSALAYAPAPITPLEAGSAPPANTGPALERPGPPGTPTAVAADREAQVTWTPPTTGGAHTGYRVFVATSASGPFSDARGTCAPVTTTASTALTCTASELTNGIAYVFRVSAVNAAGTSDPSGTSSPVTPLGVPGAPDAPSATVGDTTSVVSWAAPSSGGSAITGYVVQRSVAGGAFTSQPGCTSLGAVLACTATGLSNGTRVRFRVAAVNSAGQGPWSAASANVIPAGVPGKPDAPEAIAGVRSATVTWYPPDANGSAITGYEVTRSTTVSGQYDPVTCAESGSFPDVTTCTVSSLTAGQESFFKVRAVNTRGSGSYSEASVGVVPIAPSSAPVITAVEEGNTQLTIRYDVTASASETVWSRYSSNDGGAWSSWADSGGKTGSVTITGLVNGTTYEVQLGLAVAPAEPTSLASGTASGRPRTTPGAPTSLVATAGDGSVAVSWTAPTSTGGAPITGYVVDVGRSASGPWRTPVGSCASSTTSTATACEVGGLENGTAHYLRVAALNEAGVGAFEVSTAVTPIGAPDAPAPPVANGDRTVITVSWEAPATNGTAITGYQIRRATNALGPFTAISAGACAGTVAATSCVDSDGLTTTDTYYYVVAAESAAGTSPYSDASEGTTLVPDASAPDITAITPGDRSLSIAFTYGSAATNVSYSLDAGSTWSTRSPASTTSPLRVTGLANGTTYRVRIRMVTSGGFSGGSDIVPATPRTTPAAPAAPTGTAGNGSVELAWSAPDDDGGAPISGYTVRRSTDGVTYADQPGCTSLGIDFTCTATGLTAGTAYTFTVAAVNAAGTGAYSAASAPITPAAATCATGGTCEVGDTGPGGGTVFYVGSFTLTSTGATMRYLEAAPANWSGGGATSDPLLAWSAATSTDVTTASAIGTGAKNTASMLQASPTAAAQAVAAYRGGTLSDWFLPSSQELLALARQLGEFPAGSFVIGGYWTSTQGTSSRGTLVFPQSQSQITRPKDRSHAVRPIRAFAPVG